MENQIRDFIIVFASILYEAMPFVVLGATIAGVLEEVSPQQAFAFMMAVSVVILSLIFFPFPWYDVLPAALVAAGVVLVLLLRLHGLVNAVLEFLGRHRVLAIGMSGFLGLIMPMCECGIVPVMRRLLRKGAPLSCAICYTLAGPIINIVVLLSTYMAFKGMDTAMDSSGQPARQLGGLGMLSLRAGLGWSVAFVTALVVERQFRLYGRQLLTPLAQFRPKPKAAGNPTPSVEDEVASAEPANGGADEPARPLADRLGNIAETALHDFVDIMVFLVLGALLAASARIQFKLPDGQVLVLEQQIEELSRSRPALGVGAMMALAVVLCLCSEADAFVAASFITLRPAAKLAFLVLGPMLDFKLYMMYLRVFRQRLIWTIIPCVVLQVLLYSLIFHFIWDWETYAPYWRATTGPGP